MGKKSQGGGQTQTTVQKADPWVGVQPNLMELYGNAGNWFRNGGTQTAGMNPNLGFSMDAMRNVAGNADSSVLGRMAQNNLQSVLNNDWMNNRFANGSEIWQNPFAAGKGYAANQDANGTFLSQGNPFLQQMVEGASRDVSEQFMNDIAPALASQFSMAGRTGSGAHVNAFGTAAGGLAKRLGDISSSIRGQAYESERGRMAQANEAERQRQYGAYQSERGQQFNSFQTELDRKMQASGMAPAFMGQNLQALGALQGAGQLQRGIEQEFMSQPFNNLASYSQLLTGAAPYASSSSSGSGSTTQPYNKLTGAIGGGLTGALMGPMMGMTGPVGALIGAGLGLFG